LAGNEDDGEDAEFLEGTPEERERRFPTLEQQESTLGDGDGVSAGARKITVQELIAQRYATTLSLDFPSMSLDNVTALKICDREKLYQKFLTADVNVKKGIFCQSGKNQGSLYLILCENIYN
jgi:hypothetical protein